MTEPEQLALLRSTARRARAAPRRATPEPATDRPVARVVVDVGLAHLDRPFDYLVPAGLSDAAGPGTRVRVRFAGRLVDGFVAERAEASEHAGRLAFLQRVVSAEPVLAPETLELAREVAAHYAGTVPDVLRLAVPPRHARTESEPTLPAPDPPQRPATTTPAWASRRSGRVTRTTSRS
jgi:primosomal protein N' (replication factor Y)